MNRVRIAAKARRMRRPRRSFIGDQSSRLEGTRFGKPRYGDGCGIGARGQPHALLPMVAVRGTRRGTRLGEPRHRESRATLPGSSVAPGQGRLSG